MEDKIKKLTKAVKALSKLLMAVAELLTFATIVEMTIKTMIEIWNRL